MDSPLFSPCFFGKSPCPAWTLPDRGFPCYRLPHAGDRASKVRCFYFFVLNAAIRMTISNNTAPTSIIPKPSDVSHIQMVAAQTIFRFPSILTLLISLPWGDGRLLDTGGGGRTRTNFNPFPSCEGRHPPAPAHIVARYFNPLPSYEGRRRGGSIPPTAEQFQSTPLIRGETGYRWQALNANVFQSTPLMRGETA